MNAKIQRTHLERRAVVYLRQSTMKQVHEHRESTRRQYDLRGKASELGWTDGAIEVIDEDLGQSGSGTQNRTGFQRLALEIAKGRVGAIFALEVSRLSRSSADWHHLLDLCKLADVVIVDEQAVYAPHDFNDQLLLGLKGAMAEAEQKWIALRLQGARLNKARRGELPLIAPTGYEWDPVAGRLRFVADEQVQQAISLIFERFKVESSSYAVTRYFLQQKLKIPALRNGTQETRWIHPRQAAVLAMLRSPIYAGVYVYGRREIREGFVDGERGVRTIPLPIAAWKVCLHDRHPGYISWEEYMANQDKLHANRSNHSFPQQRGAAQDGAGLLQGMVICGRCGQRMSTTYLGERQLPRYECRASYERSMHTQNCWTVQGKAIDEAITELFLQVSRPAEVELALAVAQEAVKQAEAVDRQWKLRMDRVRYEAALSERRYKAVDPDNRVVARTLERDWEEKLGEVEAAEREYQEVRRREKVDLTEDDRIRLVALARDLPRVWHARTTTNSQRKTLLRMVVREVTLTPIDVPRKETHVQVLWETGAVTEIRLPRPRHVTGRQVPDAVIARMAELLAARLSDQEIADALNNEGVSSVTKKPWTRQVISGFRNRKGLQHPDATPLHCPLPERRADGKYSVGGVAAYFGVSMDTVYHWVQRGQLVGTRGPGLGRPLWFDLDQDTVTRLNNLPRSRVNRTKSPVGDKNGTGCAS